MQVVYRNRTWHFDKVMTVAQMLEKIHLLPENVLVVRNGKLVPEDQHVKPGDEIKVVAVISGG